MTLFELIDHCNSLVASNPELGNYPVHFQYNYGDHWRTQVAPEVSDIEEGETVYSGYHSMPKVYDREEANDKGREIDEEKITQSILIS